jgi:hypothetical protein
VAVDWALRGKKLDAAWDRFKRGALAGYREGSAELDALRFAYFSGALAALTEAMRPADAIRRELRDYFVDVLVSASADDNGSAGAGPLRES